MVKLKFKKTCHNCAKSRIIKGREIDEFHREPDMIDCVEGKVDYKLLDRYNRNPYLMPKLCQQYTPRLIDKCHHCGQEIKKPIWNWPYWVEDIFDDWPVCSIECKNAMKKKIKDMENQYDVFHFEYNDDLDENEFPF